jgi:RND family efflux transporter MFP subunit
MKNIILLSILLVVASCTPRQTEDKQDELREYRKLVMEYTEKIEVLEKEIASEIGDTEGTRGTAVEIMEIAPQEFSSYFTATGVLEALRDVYISPEVNGQISSIPVSHGDHVKKGDLLIRLNTDITQSNIDEIRTSLELAKKIFEKQEELWDKKIGSEVQYLEAKNNKESLEARLSTLQSQLELSFIRAPFSGIIDDIIVKTGELASPGMRLIRLVNLDKMKVTANVSEAFISAVKQGDEVTLEFSSYPELRITSKISRIGTVIDPVTRTFKVEVLVDNPEQLLKPNMLSSVRIRDYLDPEALTVPSIILKQDFNGTFLFRLNEKSNNQIAEKIYVKTGITVQDITKIAAGIDKGDKVIVAGYNIVSDGETVRVTN